MTTPTSLTMHASTVAIDGRAVMIEGPPGAGKSDLALRLIDRGATLVSDDYTELVRLGDDLLAAPPTTIAGRMEVRGLGIISMSHAADIPVGLLITLTDEVERLPDPLTRDIAGITVPELRLDPHPASAPIKVERALRRVLPR